MTRTNRKVCKLIKEGLKDEKGGVEYWQKLNKALNKATVKFPSDCEEASATKDDVSEAKDDETKHGKMLRELQRQLCR